MRNKGVYIHNKLQVMQRTRFCHTLFWHCYLANNFCVGLFS